MLEELGNGGFIDTLTTAVAELAGRAESVASDAESVVSDYLSDEEESSSESNDDEESSGSEAESQDSGSEDEPESRRVSEAVSTGFRDPLVLAVQRRRAAMAAS